MIQVCYSKHHEGDRKFGEKEPIQDRSETHGLCEECFPKEMRDIRIAIEKHKKAQAEACGYRETER